MISHPRWSFIILLFFHSTYFSWGEAFSVVGPSHSIISYIGEDIMLPASLSPALNAEGFQVRWFTAEFRSPVLLYTNYSIVNQTDRRMSIFQEELKNGSVSLLVQSVRVSDEGIYTCHVDSGEQQEKVQIALSVEVLGTQPSISVSSTDDQQTRLECSAEKWNPQPEVIWRDMNGADVTSQSSVTTERDMEGLLKVSSVITVKEEHNVFTCLMRSKAPKPDWASRLCVYSFSPRASGWLAAFCVLLALCVLLTPLLLIQWTRMRDRSLKYDAKVQLLRLRFLQKEVEMSQRVTNAEWSVIYSSAADVTLDLDTANPRLIVSEAGKQVRHVDTWQSMTDNPKRFDPSVFVLAKEGFTSGRHYWEVEVGEKTDWIVGVARESVDRKGDVNLSPYDGFWTLCLLKEEMFDYLALTDPDVHLPLRVNPWTVGVFLNYDEGQVSFYNAKTHTHLYTFKESFNEKLYPFFCPCDNDGGKNADPLIISIMPKVKLGRSNDLKKNSSRIRR
ncbi:butyrophilin subfamily 1 member A1-like [Polypterus senegalus]